LRFGYSRSYLGRADAISLWERELPLEDRWFEPDATTKIASCLRDAAPDLWGRRVILNRLVGRPSRDVDPGDADTMTYLLESGSDRIGGLDFQVSSSEYVSRVDSGTLEELQRAARMVEEGIPMSRPLADALVHGTSIGGARPKAILRAGDRQYVAKLSSTADHYNVVGAEAASIFLARRAGIDVPEAMVVRSLDRDVLLAERFDRPGHEIRRLILSGLTLTGRTEDESRYGSYPELLDVLRRYAADPNRLGARLFARIAFNIAISNTDDHLRNHAAFWDGKSLELTPAYDLSPVSRTGETTQAIAYGRHGERASRFADLIDVAHVYDLSRDQAKGTVDRVCEVIRAHWDEAADFARLSEVDRKYLWGRQFLHESVFYPR
jgi:serine/threonine-protein kinase HipA